MTTQQKYVFARNINNMGMDGIIDPNTQTLLCLCHDEQSKIILDALATTPHTGDMTVQEFFNDPNGMFTLDFLSEEERETLYKAIDLYAMGKVRQSQK